MLNYFGGAFAVVLLIVGLLSGALSVFREMQLMYKPPAASQRKQFWGWVRVAFVLSLCTLWYESFNSLKGREADLRKSDETKQSLQRERDQLKEETQRLTSELDFDKRNKTTNPAQPTRVVVSYAPDQLKRDTVSLIRDLEDWMNSDGRGWTPPAGLSQAQIDDFGREENKRLTKLFHERFDRRLKTVSDGLAQGGFTKVSKFALAASTDTNIPFVFELVRQLKEAAAMQ